MKRGKALKRLKARQLDYDNMMKSTRKDYRGYKRPGSIKK